MATVTRLGPGGYPRPPYGSFAGKPTSSADSKTFVRNFTVLGPGGYPKPLWGDFAGKSQSIARAAVGWTGTRRIRKDELERRLKEQRDNTFGRRRFAELQALWAAEEAASRLALETKSKAQRKALEAATKAARSAAHSAEDASAVPVAQIDALTLALHAASSAGRIKTSLDEANRAVQLARAMVAELQRLADEDDEEEALALLLMH